MSEAVGMQLERKLERERKGLLASSSLLFLQQAAGIRFGDVVVAGVRLEIERPQLVVWALWTLWVYYLLRYIVYFLALPDTGFDAAYRQIKRETFWKCARQTACRQARSEKPECEGVVYQYEPKSWHGEYETGSEFRCKIKGRFVSTGRALEQEHEEAVTLSGVTLRLCRTYTFAKAVATSAAPTEYWLPFAVAIAPLVAAAWHY